MSSVSLSYISLEKAEVPSETSEQSMNRLFTPLSEPPSMILIKLLDGNIIKKNLFVNQIASPRILTQKNHEFVPF